MLDNIDTSLDALEHIAKVVALIAALLFFYYKARSGYQVTNMSLEISYSRKATREGDYDDLAIPISLSKGDRGGIAIHDVAVRIYGKNEELISVKSPMIRRQQYKKSQDQSTEIMLVNWDEFFSGADALLNISPGDTMTVSTYCRVRSGEVCRVEVVVLGRRRFSSGFLRQFSPQGVMQWRSSIIVLPAKEPRPVRCNLDRSS